MKSVVSSVVNHTFLPRASNTSRIRRLRYVESGTAEIDTSAATFLHFFPARKPSSSRGGCGIGFSPLDDPLFEPIVVLESPPFQSQLIPPVAEG